MNIAKAISKVYVDNYDNYLNTVYPQAKKDMEERQNQLRQKMMENPVVKDWERVTHGVVVIITGFCIVLALKVHRTTILMKTPIPSITINIWTISWQCSAMSLVFS